jgi:hypothetical protein
MGVDRQADVLGVGAHLEGVHRLGDQLASTFPAPSTRVCVSTSAASSSTEGT